MHCSRGYPNFKDTLRELSIITFALVQRALLISAAIVFTHPNTLQSTALRPETGRFG